ncbi:MAG: V-type ATP synthase subunit I [Clostridiales bacterium]|nr:V-type ATP synthase subunit I [Clostridiales bacterium]
MAVDRMLKVTVIGHESVRRTAIDLLQSAGVVEIETAIVPDERLSSAALDRVRISELDEKVADATFVRDLLGRFYKRSAPFSTFIAEKVHMTRGEFDALAPDEEFERVYRECEHIAERVATIDRERIRLRALAHELAPWELLSLPIEQWRGTVHTALFCGTVPESSAEEIRQMLRDASEFVSVVEAGRADGREAWVVIAHREALDDVRATLAHTEFAAVSFAGIAGTPAAERERALSEASALDVELVEVEASATRLAAKYYTHAMALVQALLTRRDAEQVIEHVCTSECVFVASGWMPARERSALIEALAPVSGAVDLEFADPAPDDRVPVRLHNAALIRPFEVLTDLYGRPRYGDIDPTPLLAGFFFIFFGMCIGDVGYGVILAVAAWLIKTRLDVAPGVRKFMDLLMLGGVASVMVGVATRSYFALAEEALPTFLRYEPLLDPLRDVMVMLVVSVALGVVHISFGVAVNAYRKVKAGDVLGALCEDVTTLALFVAVGVVVAFPSTAGWLLPWSLVAAVVLKGRVIERAVFDRSVGGVLLGVGKGLLGLYGLVGYASDFLSYTRLAALGLASLLVGDTMNRLAGLVVDVPFGIGILAAVLILVVGHTFNVVIGLLGAFVHPTRLQFVEFFSKFYEGGGRPFAPFAPRTKQVVLHPATGEAKGGVR